MLKPATIVAILALLTNWTCPAIALPSRAVAAYIVDSESAGTGRVRITASKEAVRIDVGDNGAYIVSSKPTWRVLLFNPANKRGMEMSFDDWQKHTPTWTFMISDDGWLYNRPVFNGQPFKKWKFNCTHYDVGKNSSNHKPRVRASYETLDTPDIDDHVTRIVDKSLNVPVAPGLPLSLTMIPPDRLKTRAPIQVTLMESDNIHLRTKRVAKSTVPVSIFDYPKSFTRAHVEQDVLIDTKRIKQTEDVYQDMFGK